MARHYGKPSDVIGGAEKSASPTHGWPEDRIPPGQTPDHEREVRMECVRLVIENADIQSTAVGVIDSAEALSNFVLGLATAEIPTEKDDGKET